MTLPGGTRLGPYEILSPLGAGGMVEVYRARDTRLERAVAIKVLPRHLSASADLRERFEREAKTISRISHPHICALYDVNREGETEYNVMLTKFGVKLLDFGLAKALGPDGPVESVTSAPTAVNVTREGTFLGTWPYMAPEQLEGREVDARTDIFAFGTVLYEMATGRTAFSG